MAPHSRVLVLASLILFAGTRTCTAQQEAPDAENELPLLVETGMDNTDEQGSLPRRNPVRAF
jgi:hypothetical protein